MSMREIMYERTLLFSERIIDLVRMVPRGIAENAVLSQLVRSATSIGANYREACHASSANDFAHKLKICEGEADETLYWLQLLSRSNMMNQSILGELIAETQEFVAILTAACKSAYRKRT